MNGQEVFPPGEYVKRELDARGWTQVDLADILARPVQVVNEIVAGRRGVTPETAMGLALAFGTTPELWMNLDARYQLSQIPSDPAVGLRAVIHSKGPIKEMVRRGWLTRSADPESLRDEVLRFFELSNIHDEPHFGGYAARKATSYGETTPGQKAWLFRAKEIARKMKAEGEFGKEALATATASLRRLLVNPADVAKVPEILSAAGIRFIILEHLPKTRIDCATFWLDRDKPVVVMSFRYDRIDYFWYTLFHELGHVSAGDGRDGSFFLDIDLIGVQTATARAKPPVEESANRFASDTLVPTEHIAEFIDRVGPAYSRRRIEDLARSVGVHAGIVVGQLQHLGEIQYSHSRDLLVKVRDFIVDVATTDGWGRTPSFV